MRIVGGKYKSRVLLSFEKLGIRPTSDMVRESFFNIIRNVVYDANFLDLFAGTGAMGIEAISRGAKSVTFNDFSRESVNLIKKNLEKLSVVEDYKITNFDGVNFLKRTSDKFDVIYIDPPYNCDFLQEVLDNMRNCLTDNGIAVVESEKPIDIQVDGLEIFDRRKYGRACLTFYKKEEKL